MASLVEDILQEACEAVFTTDANLSRRVMARDEDVDMEEVEVEAEVIRLVAREVCDKHRIIPISKTGASLVVAMADPTDLNAYDEVARLTRREIDLAVVAESQLLAAP